MPEMPDPLMIPYPLLQSLARALVGFRWPLDAAMGARGPPSSERRPPINCRATGP